MINKNLSAHQNIITVWFNAWRYEKEEHQIVSLIVTIINEIKCHKKALERPKNSGASLVRALRAVAYGFPAKAKIKKAGFAEIEASFIAKDMIEREDFLNLTPSWKRSKLFT